MNSKEKPATVVAGDPPARGSGEGDGVSRDLGIKEPEDVAPSEGAVPLSASETIGNAKECSAGGHERNGSLSGAFLSAPGYSPSFASLRDRNAFESHHAPRYSDTFEGFEPPRLSHSQEVQETPKVTRPEGLSFTSPTVDHKILEDVDESPQISHVGGAGTAGYRNPFLVEDQEGEKQAEEDYSSPIANLVEKPVSDAAPASPSTPTELVPAMGNADSFSFGGMPQTSQTFNEPHTTPKIIPGDAALPSRSIPTELVPAMGNADSFSFGGMPQTSQTFNEPHTTPKIIAGDPALPSPSTPTELVPALGNVSSFSFGGMPETPNEPHTMSKGIAGDNFHPSPSTPTELVPALGNVDSFSFGSTPETPQTMHEPHVTLRKIPGHELLGSFMTLNKSSTHTTHEGLHGVNATGSPVVEASSSAPSDLPLSQEARKEPTSVVPQLKPDAAEIVQSKMHEALPPEEPVVASVPSEKSENHAIDLPVFNAKDTPTIHKSVDPSNVTASSEGIGEEVVEKPVEHGTDKVDEKQVGSALPQTQIAGSPETFVFRNVDAEKEVSTSATTKTSKPGPLLGRLTTMNTKKWRGPTDDELRTMVVIPDYLSRDMASAVATEGSAIPEGPPQGVQREAPTSPILVFINSRSGGRLGPELMEHFEELISPNQVYDLSKHSPSAVLRYGVGCLDKLVNSGDECARKTRENLRILVAGGDGTVGWCLSSVGALRELSATNTVPPVGVIPLGTGNDLSRSFGWGGEFSSTARSSLKRCLVKALDSSPAPLDTWKAIVVPAKTVAAADIQFPHAMQPQHHVPLPSSVAGEKHDKDETDPAFEGLFFNYFSVGMDAQVAYGFHHLRDEKPWLARGRTANQMIYSSFGCTQGWFCTACSMAPRARGVSNILKLSVRKKGSASKDWEEIQLPSNIRAVVICNLQSYAGGRNPWGKPSSATRLKEGFEEQRPDDGLLEIMGLKDGWHSSFVLLEVCTAVRLCQAEAVKLELSGSARTKAYMQMDGEPWMQPMGKPHDEPTVVTIQKLPNPSMLLKR